MDIYPEHLKHLYLAEEEKIKDEEQKRNQKRNKPVEITSNDQTTPNVSETPSTFTDLIKSPYKRQKKFQNQSSYQKTQEEYKRIQEERNKKRQLSTGVKIEKSNNKGLLPIHCAVMQGRQDAIDLLLQCDIDGQLRRKLECMSKTDSPSLLYLAVANGHLTCADWLATRRFTFKPAEQEELLYELFQEDTAIQEKTKSLEFLIKSGTNINTVYEGGNSVLHLAALKSDLIEMLVILLKAGAEVNKCNNERHTPLFYAVQISNLHGADLLLRNGRLLASSKTLSFLLSRLQPSYGWRQPLLKSPGYAPDAFQQSSTGTPQCGGSANCAPGSTLGVPSPLPPSTSATPRAPKELGHSVTLTKGPYKVVFQSSVPVVPIATRVVPAGSPPQPPVPPVSTNISVFK
ncbi:TANC1 protein, partial [Polypterus senegalus]